MHVAILEQEPVFALGLKSVILDVESNAEFADTVCTIQQLNELNSIRAAFISVPAKLYPGGLSKTFKRLRHDLAVCGILANDREKAAPHNGLCTRFHKIIYRDASVSEISATCRQFFEIDVRKRQPKGRWNGKTDNCGMRFWQSNVSLPPRQIEALRYIVKGKTNSEIAAEMGISVNTVRGYVSYLLIALNAANRTQAAIFGQDYLRSRRPEKAAPRDELPRP